MKKLKLACLGFFAAGIMLSPGISQAQFGVSGNPDCALWLCAPYSFPEGCEAMKERLQERVKEGLPALPTYDSCSLGDPAYYGDFKVEYEDLQTCSYSYTLIDRTPEEQLEPEDTDAEEIDKDEAEEIDGDEAEDEDAREDAEDNSINITLLSQVCEKCDVTETGETICETVPPTLSRRVKSVTVSVSGTTYPTYVFE